MAVTLCQIDEIPEAGARGFNLPGVKLFAVKRRGEIYLYLNRCPHLGLPLEWDRDQFLDNEGEYIRCHNHGALFVRETGECLLGPCRGESLWSVPFQVLDGQVTIADEDLPLAL